MEWDSLVRWCRNLFTVSAVALVLHEHIPKNAECFGTTYLMFLARKWMRIVKQTLIRVQVILGPERFCDLELARRRKAVELLNPKLADGASEEVETILDREIQLRIFRPENQTNKAGIMYFHGGGFVMCHVKMYRKFLSYLANHTGSVVFCVNYRKAPEHPFPAGQLDVFDSTLYLFQNASKYGFDPNEVIFTGDSAGGFLSINCWYRFHLSKYPFRPKGISLLYPALGYTLDTPSFQRNKRYPPLTMESCAFFILCLTNESHEPYQYRLLYNNEHYDESLLSSEFTDRANPEKFLDSEEKQNWKPKLRNPKRKFTKKEIEFRQKVSKMISDPMYIPLFIPDDDLMSLPPVVTFGCEHDVLKNDAQILHSRLSSLGKQSELHILEGTLHGCMVLSKQKFGFGMFKKHTEYASKYFDSVSKLIQNLK